MKRGIKSILAVVVISLVSMSTVFGQNDDDQGISSGKGPRYGTDSVNCVMHLSLYREFYKQKNFKDAMPHWRWVINNCPIATQNMYIDGAKLISAKIDELTDTTLRNKYIDTLMMVYDQRIVNFDREAYVLGRKGIDMVGYHPERIEQNYQVLKKSVDIAGNKSESTVLAYYFQSVIGMVQHQKLDKLAIVEAYEQVSNIVGFNLNKNKENPKAYGNWMSISSNIEAAFEPYASCEDLISTFSKKYAETPNDIDLLTKITTLLDKKNCVNSDLFFSATESLHKLQPNGNSAYLMGTLARDRKQLSKAADYLNQAVALSESNDDKIKALNLLASVNYEQHNFSQARSNAQRILQINPNYGKAYIFIGDLYASSSSMCNADDLGGKTVFWAAIDMYYKAKSIDPSVAEEANNKINQYSRYFPASTDLFFRDMVEGTSYTVGCWINESTIIRGIK